MWEQIRSNKRKTTVLVGMMGLLLLGLGFVITEAYAPGAGLYGLLGALVFWAILALSAYFRGDSILLAVSRARRIEKEDDPVLFNVVEEMKIASGLPKMPSVYIVNDMGMNAFAVGRDPNRAAVAVSAGLRGKLNRDELQGVIAHEVSHIVNRDVLLMTMVGVMLGAIVMISEVFLRSMWYTGGRSRRYSSKGKGGGKAQGIIMIVAIVLAILAPLLARLIYFAVSRRREFLADASAARLTRYPEGLASALEQLGQGSSSLRSANKATAPMFIVNPFRKASLNELTSTHPRLSHRINILRSMGGSVSYGTYQAAWRKVSGKKAGHLPGSALDTKESVAARDAHPDSTSHEGRRRQRREAGDLMRKINQFIFLPCVCGLRLKLPPDFKKDHLDCPKCKRELTVPVAQLAALAAVAGTLGDGMDIAEAHQKKGGAPKKQERLTIKRKPGAWMSFRCTCGDTKSLSPAFDLEFLKCDVCGNTTHIVSS